MNSKNSSMLVKSDKKNVLLEILNDDVNFS